MLDGEMVGPPMVKIAQRILSQGPLEKVEVATMIGEVPRYGLDLNTAVPGQILESPRSHR